MTLLEFVDDVGRSPFARRFDDLQPLTAAKVAVALVRMEKGNLSNVKSVRAGVQEYRIDFGPGYRLYFGRDGDTLIVLLCDGIKRRRQDDIDEARANWAADKRRKMRER